MSITDGGALTAADVAAVMNGGNNGRGFGWGGDGAWWVLILFLFAFGGGWGNGGFGNNGYQADMQRGFDQQATSAGIASLQAQVGNGFADAALATCQGNANTVAAITGAKDAINSTLYTNQNATNQAMNTLAMSLQNCCCENRAGLADLKYTVATENCADRQALSDGLRDVIANNTANTQAIIQSQQQGFQGIQDKLCQLEIDGLKSANEQLRTQLNMANLAASQTAQTAAILQNNEAQTANLLQRLNPNPIPAYMVQNPNCCGAVNFGCGCGA